MGENLVANNKLSAQLYSEYTKAAIQTNLFENISTSWSVTRK